MSNAIAAPPPKPAELIAQIKDRSLTVNQRLRSVGSFLEMNKASMFSALPKHITPDRLIRVALNCIRHTPKLLDCSPESLFSALIEASALGLETNGVLGHAYLVPYKTECTLIPGYKGLIDLCRRSGTISTFTAEVVRDGDTFAYQLGDDPFVRHVPNDMDAKRHEKKPTYAYVVVKLRDGGIQRKVWSAAKIDAHKEQYSQAWRWAEKGDRAKGGGKKDSSWHTNWDEMAKKTVIRDLINRGEIPVSVEIQRLAMREELYEAERARIVDHPALGVTLGELDSALTGGQAGNGGPPAGDQEPPPDTYNDDAPDTDFTTDLRSRLAECDTREPIAHVEVDFMARAETEDERNICAGECGQARERLPAPKGKQGKLSGT